MDADEPRPVVRRPRKVTRAALPAGPVRQLRDAIYELYLQADHPQLAYLAEAIAADDDLVASPGKDVIGRIIGAGGPASRQDTVTVAIALARAAGEEQARVEAEVRRLWLAAQTASALAQPARLGRLVTDCDPMELEVHPAIESSGGPLDSLPVYVPRAHDTQLRQVVDGLLADGRSRLITVVAGSSTGKTRACWELAQYLEQQDPRRWRLWHPYDPTRPEAAAAAVDQAGPYTIVWLNEAQHYLSPADVRLGEWIAAGLRTLLHDPHRGPVLVLATLWPQHWDTLTTRPEEVEPVRWSVYKILDEGVHT